jgi:tRNA (guanine-N7-)-methyltransferase
LTLRQKASFITRMEESAAGLKPPATLIYRPESVTDRMDPARLFPLPQPLEVELGSGDGSFIVQWAKLNPGRNFLAVERLLGRLRKIERKGQRNALTNLRLLRMEAWYVLEYLLPLASVSAVHIYFPDPWPKRKHRKNRLINEAFAETAARALAAGGLVYLRTDDADYFKQMTEVFKGNDKFKAVETPKEVCEVVTDFEREFHKRGVPTLRAAYQKTNHGAERR